MEPESTDSERASLLRHREFLENARQTTSGDRDKLVLTIASGSLTVSVALLERVAANIGPWQIGFWDAKQGLETTGS